MGLIIKVRNHKKISEPSEFLIEDFLNYKEMISYLGYFNLIKKLDIVLAPSSELPLFIGNCSFSNVDYVFNYLLCKSSQSASLSESIFAGGKGFTYYKAICSALGEAFERIMGCFEYFIQKDNIVLSSYNKLIELNKNVINPKEYIIFSNEQYKQNNFLFDKFTENSIIGWLPMKEYLSNKEILFPACLVLMYYSQQSNDEDIIGYSTSGGLTSHFEDERGVFHGIKEIIERHEINLSWYCKIKPKKLILDKINNKKLIKLNNYIKEKNINFYLHNIEQMKFYVVTAMSFDRDMTKYSFNAGGGVSENIEEAILMALEEYMQSVNNTRKIVYAPNWITSQFSNRILNVNECDDPRKFKTFYQAVSYYGLSKYRNKLDWFVKENEKINISNISRKTNSVSILEYILKNNIKPIYSSLEIQNLFKRIYISKVYMKEFSPAFIAGLPALGHKSYNIYLREGELINDKILPFP